MCAGWWGISCCGFMCKHAIFSLITLITFMWLFRRMNLVKEEVFNNRPIFISVFIQQSAHLFQACNSALEEKCFPSWKTFWECIQLWLSWISTLSIFPLPSRPSEPDQDLGFNIFIRCYRKVLFKKRDLGSRVTEMVLKVWLNIIRASPFHFKCTM